MPVKKKNQTLVYHVTISKNRVDCRETSLPNYTALSNSSTSSLLPSLYHVSDWVITERVSAYVLPFCFICSFSSMASCFSALWKKIAICYARFSVVLNQFSSEICFIKSWIPWLSQGTKKKTFPYGFFPHNRPERAHNWGCICCPRVIFCDCPTRSEIYSFIRPSC